MKHEKAIEDLRNQISEYLATIHRYERDRDFALERIDQYKKLIADNYDAIACLEDDQEM